MQHYCCWMCFNISTDSQVTFYSNGHVELLNRLYICWLLSVQRALQLVLIRKLIMRRGQTRFLTSGLPKYAQLTHTHTNTIQKIHVCAQTVDRCFRLSAEAELLLQLISGNAGCFVVRLSAN